MKFLKVKEAAELLRTPPNTLYRLIYDGTLVKLGIAKKIKGIGWRIDEQKFLEALENGTLIEGLTVKHKK